MASKKMIFIALCLAVLVCDGLAQGRFGASPGRRLRESCSIYTHEKNDQGNGKCDPNVLEKVEEYDRKIHGDTFMKTIYRQAKQRGLCYAQGPIVREVRGACDALEVACNQFTRAPVDIDECWSIVIAAARPPVSPPVTTRPYVPDVPPGPRL